MLEKVKDFIEYNIDLIEEQNWEELFKNWYLYKNDYYFEDMMDVLKVAIPDIYRITQETRATVLENIAISVFASLAYKNKRVTFETIVQELSSLFGFEGQDLIDVLDRAAKQAGLNKATNGWYRV